MYPASAPRLKMLLCHAPDSGVAEVVSLRGNTRRPSLHPGALRVVGLCRASFGSSSPILRDSLVWPIKTLIPFPSLRLFHAV